MIPLSSLVVGIILFIQAWVKNTFRYFLHAWVFFIPFTAMAFVNFYYSGTIKSISMAHVLAMIVIFLYLFNFKNIMVKNSKYFYILFSIYTAIAISLMVNIIWPAHFPVYSANYLHKDEIINIEITFRNMLNFFYFLIGSFMFLVLIEKVNTKADFLLIIKIFLISVGFMSIWGVLQGLFYRLGINYPFYLFNTSMNENALGYTGFYAGIKRISSFATEPSIMAQTILIGLALLIFFKRENIYLFSRSKTSILLTLMIITLLASTSFIAYVGLVVLSLFYVSRNIVKLIFLTVSMMLVSLGLHSLVMTKLSSYSTLERLNSIVTGFEYYTHSPIFGLGFASVTSHDLVVNLLVNIGGVGFILFLFLVCVILFEEKTVFSSIMKIVLLFVLVLQQLTGFTYVYFMFWLVLGLTVVSSRMKNYLGDENEKSSYPRLV